LHQASLLTQQKCFRQVTDTSRNQLTWYGHVRQKEDYSSYRYFKEPDYMVRPCKAEGRLLKIAMKWTQNSNKVDAETTESTRKTKGKLDGRYKEGHERKKPK
jgi:Asp-tRNA(Asn)/Glu-tRNA(Gln) amidotransferase B subunit